MFILLLTYCIMKCSCCDAAISKDDPSISCNVCSKVFRATCTEVTRSDLKRFGPTTGIFWSCKDCRNLDLRSLILALQEDIRELKSKPVAPVVSSTETLIRSEEIIQEVVERDRRRNNVIVYGVTESKSNSKDERTSTDMSEVRQIFNYIGATVPDNMKTVRLGRFDPTKAISKRPLKISFSIPDVVPNLLKKSKLLKDCVEHPGVFVSSDRTPFQQKLFNAVKAELIDRKSRGEDNIRLKYVNGIPKIVSSEN